LNKAIDLKPTSADAYRYRCSARIAKRDFTGAISDCSKTLSLNPRYVDAYFARGNAYNALAEWGAGIADLTQTIKLDPRASDAYNHRAWPYLMNSEPFFTRLSISICAITDTMMMVPPTIAHLDGCSPMKRKTQIGFKTGST